MASYLYNKEGPLWKMSVADVADKDGDQMGNVVIKMLAATVSLGNNERWLRQED